MKKSITTLQTTSKTMGKTTTSQNNENLTPNRQYKDTLFKYIFGKAENKRWLLSLYNALAGTSHTDENEIELNTIEDVTYITRKNDVSFLIGSEMYLFEHQSTFNPNLPLRGLLYFASLYSKYIATNRKTYTTRTGKEIDITLFTGQVFKIPAPRFYVMYNGERNLDDRTFLRLSDAFKTPSEGFEWTATVLNINYDHNKKLLDACKCLHDYAMYVKMVRENETERNMSRWAAIDAALDEAIRLNLLEGFFRIHRAEVREVSILEEEFDMESYVEDICYIAVHDAKIENARNLLTKGISVDIISECIGLPLDEVTALQMETTEAIQ